MSEQPQDSNGTQQPQQQQRPLTLVMPVISPAHAVALRQTIEQLAGSAQNPIATALDALHSVHFARFVLLEDDTRLAVITSYDGERDRYIMEFIEALGPVFDKLLECVEGAPPTPVQQHRDEFVQYVADHDVASIGSFYSAYPELAVNDILALRPPAAAAGVSAS
jgi:hypothetical protein